MTASPLTLDKGLHRGIPASEYHAIPAIGSTRLEWLSVSPLYYDYMVHQEATETPSMALGTAVHVATLEPERFERDFCVEPDVSKFPSASPRATKAYKQEVSDMEQGGYTVLRTDVMEKVRQMSAAVRVHPLAAKLLDRCQDREVTMLWERGGRLCRGRADMINAPEAVMGDLKTTRSLATFSPFAITRYRYYVQAPWYMDGFHRIDGRHIRFYFQVAAESSPPYDVGVFEMDEGALMAGAQECDRLMELLDECTRTNEWPGRFPDLQRGTITDALAQQLLGEEEVA